MKRSTCPRQGKHKIDGPDKALTIAMSIPSALMYIMWYSKGFLHVTHKCDINRSALEYLENKKRQCWFCCHMLSGNCQAGPLFGVVDAGKTNIVVFYSLSNAFDLTLY